MIFNGTIYEEVAEMGSGNGLRTLLLKSEERKFLVYKEVFRESEEVFLKLKKFPHPNIIQIYGLKAIDEEKTGVVMEYFPSDTLEDRIREVALPLKEVKKIMLQVCSAVRHFHQQGIIHRDLKPFNILINQEGKIKITDFGIARIYKKEKVCDTQILGTAGYAAPEQFGFIQTDEKTDIYALGVIMNKMLTGKMPGDELYSGDIRISEIIRRCILMSPKERCSVDEIEEELGGKPANRSSLTKRLLRRIPGFRTGNKVHMTLAVVNDVYMLLIFLFTIPQRQSLGEILKGMAGLLLITVGMGWFIGSFPRMCGRLHINHWPGKAVMVLLYGIVAFFILGVGLMGMV